MDNILLVFVCLIMGLGMQKVATFPKNGHLALNQFVIYIALPALALYYIPKVTVSTDLLYPIGVAWIGFLFSFLFFYTLGKKMGWPNRLIGCLVITAGLGNTSFVGFPIIQALYGEEGLKTAIMVDQPGSFVVMATLGIITAGIFSKGEPSRNEIIKKIILFPPFIAFVLACAMNLLRFDFNNHLQTVFQKLGATVTPVALVAVGLQLKIDKESQHWKFLRLGLFFKLILTPALFFLLYRIMLGGQGVAVDVAIMESAMAPMITGAILASNYGLKPKLSSMMVGIGIPLSFLSLAFWYYILTHF
ncbi:AEC family transporter [Flavobacterium sedimenticola]|uniref:AEC family transporter n=1 Tax=Flavobacterium sedimenticola TaxID=3043286 RepID=A0ABT6XQI9_9FLAO|nr:AEC family transporter [Flavobacterium sedimenticola]MDI9257242.1 AEC family transporter [Flavobacterium sedimenticola]